jgi:rhodanese-related sulfurtransferase
MADPKRISAVEAHRLLGEGFTYVDVRTEQEFELGHPAGAHNVPFQLAGDAGRVANPDFLSVIEAIFPKDAKLVLGCQTGNRSLKAARDLMNAGYTNIVEQRAGWAGSRDEFGVLEPGWSKASLPIETGKPSGRSYPDARAKL